MKRFHSIQILVLVAVLLASLATEAAPSAVVADWTFNNTLNDVSGYGNNLMVLTGAVSYVSGPFLGQKALQLNGDTLLTTTRQTFPVGVPYGNNPFTVALYVKASPTTSLYAGLIGYGSNDTNRMESLRLGTETASSATSVTDYSWNNDTTASLPAGQSFTNAWHSIVATFNGSLESIYLDGSLAASHSGMTLNVGTNWLYIGGAVAAHDFTGALADVSIANFAATPSQIASYQTTGQLIFATPSPVPEPATLALVGLGVASFRLIRRRA